MVAVLFGIVSFVVFFFQAEDGIRDLVRSRGLGDVYKRQLFGLPLKHGSVNIVLSIIMCGRRSFWAVR